MSHTACKECGYYGGRQVIKLENPLVEAKKKTVKKAKTEKKAS